MNCQCPHRLFVSEPEQVCSVLCGVGAGNPGYGTVALTTRSLLHPLECPDPEPSLSPRPFPTTHDSQKLTDTQSSIVRKR